MLLSIPNVRNEMGSLGIIEFKSLIDFEVKRTYFIHSIPEGSERGSHAHKALWQLMFAPSGAFKICLDDGVSFYEFKLENASQALLIPPGYWRTLRDFSSHAVCVVLASDVYDESDYIRNYDEFLKWRSS
jgi:dTDP-4-dehydrorhamnose 3,5-epimerase-like enzyme